MKKIILIIVAIISVNLLSCRSNELNNFREGVNFKTIDTFYVEYDNVGNVDGFNVIVKIDTSLYSAHLNEYGKLNRIYRKLKIK
jgi:hypothetical protein